MTRACKRVLAIALGAALPGLAIAQNVPPPSLPVETVHADGIREIEMVVSRAGWHLLGSVPEEYRIGVAETDGMTGPVAALIQACGDTADGHGTLERTVGVEDYAGKHVRVTGRARLKGAGQSIFYINIIGPGGRTLRQVSMRNGSRDWENKALVLDMEKSAIAMDIGITLIGTNPATAWLDAVRIDVVDDRTPNAGTVTTNGYVRRLDDAVVSCDGAPDGVSH